MSDDIGEASPERSLSAIDALTKDAATKGVAVIDIDGVLADVGHRLHHIEGRPKDWAAFFAGAADDPVLPEGAAVARQAAQDGLEVMYLTGRPQRLRGDTEAWLRRCGLPDGPLLMRPDRDFRPARVFKVQALTDLDRDVAWVLDDDPEVIEALSEAGFSTRLADWAQRSRALHQAQEAIGRT